MEPKFSRAGGEPERTQIQTNPRGAASASGRPQGGARFLRELMTERTQFSGTSQSSRVAVAQAVAMNFRVFFDGGRSARTKPNFQAIAARWAFTGTETARGDPLGVRLSGGPGNLLEYPFWRLWIIPLWHRP